MTLTRSLVVCAVLGIWAGACASAPGQPAVSVPLEVPEPPARAALEPAAIAEAAPPERPARPTAGTTEPSGGRQGRASSTPSPTPAAPPANPQSAVPAATTSPELRAGGSAGQTRSVQEVRAIMARTSQKLDRLDRARLTAGQQADFDTARRFLAQAEQGIRANNLMLAQYSAEKAETLINGLR
jgi:hypothetical protein